MKFLKRLILQLNRRKKLNSKFKKINVHRKFNMRKKFKVCKKKKIRKFIKILSKKSKKDIMRTKIVLIDHSIRFVMINFRSIELSFEIFNKTVKHVKIKVKFINTKAKKLNNNSDQFFHTDNTRYSPDFQSIFRVKSKNNFKKFFNYYLKRYKLFRNTKKHYI